MAEQRPTPRTDALTVKSRDSFGIGTDIVVGVTSGIGANLGADAIKAGVKLTAEKLKGGPDAKK